MTHSRELPLVLVAAIAILVSVSPCGANGRFEKDSAGRDALGRDRHSEDFQLEEPDSREVSQPIVTIPVATAEPAEIADRGLDVLAVETVPRAASRSETIVPIGGEHQGENSGPLQSDERSAEAWWPAALGEKRAGEPVYSDPVAEYLRANAPYYAGHLPPGQESTRERIIQAYHRGRILSDWRNLQPHLPERVTDVLDIGSGLGVVDLLIYRHLGEPHLSFVDQAKRSLGKVRFNVLELSREFLAANGVPFGKMTHLDAHDPETLKRLLVRSYDLVLSLRGLGYLFPYELYRDTILTAIAPGGSLILDARDMAYSRAHFPTETAELEAAGVAGHEELIRRLQHDFKSARVLEHRGTDRVRLLAQEKR